MTEIFPGQVWQSKDGLYCVEVLASQTDGSSLSENIVRIKSLMDSKNALMFAGGIYYIFIADLRLNWLWINQPIVAESEKTGPAAASIRRRRQVRVEASLLGALHYRRMRRMAAFGRTSR